VYSIACKLIENNQKEHYGGGYLVVDFCMPETGLNVEKSKSLEL
jgi:hypothetical protein